MPSKIHKHANLCTEEAVSNIQPPKADNREYTNKFKYKVPLSGKLYHLWLSLLISAHLRLSLSMGAQKVDRRLQRNGRLGLKVLNLRGVFDGTIAFVSFFTRSGGTPGTARRLGTSRSLPVAILGSAACLSCDRNVHDPTTMRDVGVLPQTNITICTHIHA